MIQDPTLTPKQPEPKPPPQDDLDEFMTRWNAKNPPPGQEPQVTLEDFTRSRRQYYGIGANEGLQAPPRSAAMKYGLNLADPFENVEASLRYLSQSRRQAQPKYTAPKTQRMSQSPALTTAPQQQQAAAPAEPSWGQKMYTWMAQGGEQAQQMIGQGLGLAGYLYGVPLGTNAAALTPAAKKTQEQTSQRLAQREARIPNTMANKVAGGVVKSLPALALTALMGEGFGGGTAGNLLAGAGVGAAGADWSDPKRAAFETGTQLVAPIIGGKLGSAAFNPLTQRLVNPIARKVSDVAGHALGGAIGGAGQNLTEQLVYGSREYQGAVSELKKMVNALPAEQRTWRKSALPGFIKQQGLQITPQELQRRLELGGIKFVD